MNTCRTLVAGASCTVLLLGASAQAQTKPERVTTRPTTGPTTRLTTRPTTKPAEITPDAEALLNRLDRWRAHADGVSVMGTVVGEFDVAGRSRRFELHVTGYADNQGRFVHDAAGVGRVVQTAEQVFIFDQRRNSYAVLSSPAGKPDDYEVPEAVFEILIDENPMLLPLLTSDPRHILVRGAGKVRVADGELVIESDEEVRSIRLDESGRIISMRIDYSPLMKSRGAEAVKQARAVLTYESVESKLPDSPDFTFKPPAASTEMFLPSELMKEQIRDLRSRTPVRVTRPGPTTQPSGASEVDKRPTTSPATSD